VYFVEKNGGHLSMSTQVSHSRKLVLDQIVEPIQTQKHNVREDVIILEFFG
jgi:hypothetical protein